MVAQGQFILGKVFLKLLFISGFTLFFEVKFLVRNYARENCVTFRKSESESQ